MTDPIVPVEGETENPPWQQRPGEPNRWYARFRAYLDLGHTRTILAAYRHVAGTRKTTVSSQWYAIASQWQWDRRAAAYDEHTRNTLREQESQRRFDLREQHLRMSGQITALLYQMILDFLSTLDSKRIHANFGHLRSLYRDLLEIERSEMGLVDPQTDNALAADDMVKLRDSFFDFLGKTAGSLPFPSEEIDPERLNHAADILCDLYPTAADAERLAQVAGLQRRPLDWGSSGDGSPLHIWRAFVTAAHGDGVLIALVSAALRDHPGHAKLVDLLRMSL